MKITKEKIKQIIKEELAQQASSVGGSNVKKLLQQNQIVGVFITIESPASRGEATC